ncbi:MAG: FHA domain-containing protein [Prochloraceae cyanobacterium]
MERADRNYLHLLAIDLEEKRQTIELTKDIYTIGRSPQCSIFIDYQIISRHHATLIRTKNKDDRLFGYSILDGNLNGKKSLNGIFVNGTYQLSCQLKDGDIILFDNCIMSEVPIKIKYFVVAINEADSSLNLDRNETSEIRLKKENYKETILKVRDFWDELV